MLTKSKLINVYTLISKRFLKVKLKSVHFKYYFVPLYQK